MSTTKRVTLAEGWVIDLDSENKGIIEQWFQKGPSETSAAITVPGIIQQVHPGYHGVVWYWLRFTSAITPEPAEKCSLYFGAVDYYAEVWLNGQYLGHHEGGETPFEFDCTESLLVGSENLLAVRVINPTNEEIDGFVLKETPHYCKAIPYGVGGAYNHGGITLPVYLYIHPPVSIIDVFAQTDCTNGTILLSISLTNETAEMVNAQLIAKAAQRKSSYNVVETIESLNVDLKQGTNDVKMELQILGPRLWSLEDPFLYSVTVNLEIMGETNKGMIHEFNIRCGFRDFRLDENGFFQLNGKRIFLKSSHTVNHFPIGQKVAPNMDLLKRDLLYAKAAGFNMIRFIANMPDPEQLDYCDEIGLMVYEENYAGWMLEDSPYMKERFNSSLTGMILRDRNHPSVVVWGLMNESKNDAVFQHAVTSLSLVRNLDDSRLVLLNSGRWDGQHSIGSASNPQTSHWQHVWGGENGDAPTIPFTSVEPADPGGTPGAYMPNGGDVHLYPHVPQEQVTIDFIRSLGSSGKNIFISEYGIGSLVNAIRVTRRFEQEGASAELEDAALYRSYMELYLADWQKYGMEHVYPFPEDMLIESQKLNSRWRLEGLNAIRANPHICGYNLTGTVDQVMAGEGLWTTWRELKPGMMDALHDGLASLRWCMFVTPMHVYSGRAFKIEVVLANEGILKPGTYPSCFKIFGPEGVVWSRTVDVVIPAADKDNEMLFAVPVFSDEVVVEGPSGKYCFAASMEKGGAPAGGRLDFYLSQPVKKQVEYAEVSLLGIRHEVKEWLTAQGILWQEYSSKYEMKPKMILIGDPNIVSFTDLDWAELYICIEEGAVAIFLQPAAFQKDEDKVGWLPFTQKGKCEPFTNWLYHREDVAKKHPIFEGLQSGGILDWSYYGQIVPYVLFEGQQTPDEVIAAGFAVGYTSREPEGYKSGVVLAGYRHGAGKFMINTLRILENLDQNPAADRLLVNLIQYCAITEVEEY